MADEEHWTETLERELKDIQGDEARLAKVMEYVPVRSHALRMLGCIDGEDPSDVVDLSRRPRPAWAD